MENAVQALSASQFMQNKLGISLGQRRRTQYRVQYHTNRTYESVPLFHIRRFQCESNISHNAKYTGRPQHRRNAGWNGMVGSRIVHCHGYWMGYMGTGAAAAAA